MDFIAITRDKIDTNNSLALLGDPSCGATACFIGTTRDFFDGKKVTHLSYEAYEKMAINELQKVCDTMKNKFSVKNVALVHRIGIVPVCETSVLVAASSTHRKEALEAVSFGIDAIKAHVPIWKKEEYSDGSSSWKVNKEYTRSLDC